MKLNIFKPLIKYGKVVLFLILTPILLFIYPFKNKYTILLDKNRERTLDEMLAKYGTKYTDGFFSNMWYEEQKFEEIRQWTAAYGDEEARRMYKEKYFNDKKQENCTIMNT